MVKIRFVARALSLLIGVLFIAAFAAPRVHADLLVSSGFTNEVLRYDGTTGAFIGVFASDPTPAVATSGLKFPQGLVFGPDGNLYVASNPAGDDSVLRFNGTTGAFMDTFTSGGVLNQTRGLTFGPDGNLYVSSEGSNDVQRYNGITGTFIDAFASVSGPRGLTFISPDSNLYVASFGGENVQRFDGDTGAFMDNFAPADPAVGTLDGGPFDLTFGPDGNLYVGADGNNNVQRYNGTTGDFIGVFASGGGLATPRGILFGPDGNLYVSSRDSDEVLRYEGASGVFIDAFVSAGSGGLDFPTFLTFTPSSAVLEPSTLLLLGSGLAGLGLWRRRKFRGV